MLTENKVLFGILIIFITQSYVFLEIQKRSFTKENEKNWCNDVIIDYNFIIWTFLLSLLLLLERWVSITK